MTIMIVGGGMAGATLALAISHLSGGKLAVDLIETRSPDESQHPGFDARAIALAQGTSMQLDAIGVWQTLSPVATPITHIHVSDRGHAGRVQLQARDYRVPALGHVVELHDVGKRLFALLQHAPGVRLHCPATVVSLQREANSASLLLDNGTRLEGSCWWRPTVHAPGWRSMQGSSGSTRLMNRWRSLLTSRPRKRIRAAPMSVLPNTARWHCCQ